MSKRVAAAVVSNTERGFKRHKVGFTSNRAFLSLRHSANDPKLKISEDDISVTIKDKFPKAKYHYLIIPKDDVDNLQQLSSDEHLHLLRHLHERAINLIDEIIEKNEFDSIEFKIGYHAVPSMTPLHIHVISQDFNSESLKTKKHWNSFVSPFFLLSTNVIQEFERKKAISINKELYESFLQSSLKCHKCCYAPNNMPDLKKHLLKHTGCKH